jgi:hypothetical protein
MTRSTQLSDIDLLSECSWSNGAPYDQFERLRNEAPVFWHEEPDGAGFWADQARRCQGHQPQHRSVVDRTRRSVDGGLHHA